MGANGAFSLPTASPRSRKCQLGRCAPRPVSLLDTPPSPRPGRRRLGSEGLAKPRGAAPRLGSHPTRACASGLSLRRVRSVPEAPARASSHPAAFAATRASGDSLPRCAAPLPRPARALQSPPGTPRAESEGRPNPGATLPSPRVASSCHNSPRWCPLTHPRSPRRVAHSRLPSSPRPSRQAPAPHAIHRPERGITARSSGGAAQMVSRLGPPGSG
jgi:hypothetical protein